MRIVYDDTQAKHFVEILYKFINHLDIKSIVEYTYGMNRVQGSMVKEQLNKFINEYNMSIGDTVTHLHGIGNNCAYPVYFKAENETQECCSICLNSDMFGGLYVYVEDYNKKRLSQTYEINSHRISVAQ